MQEIQLLPENLLKMPSVNLVQQWYVRSFKEMLEFEEVKTDTIHLRKWDKLTIKINV